MTRRLNTLILAFLLLVGLPCYWLFFNASTGPERTRDLPLGELRQLAGSIEGPRPVGLRYRAIGSRSVASNMLAAGTGIRPVLFTLRAYQLVMEDGSTVVIDNGLTPDLARQIGISKVEPGTFAALGAARRAAAKRLVLADFSDATRRKERNGPASGAPFAVAPGVVFIPTPRLGIARGMAFVKMANGREYLFTGEIAKVRANWRDVRPPARMMTSHFRPQDRDDLVEWLMTINAWARQAPLMRVVEGYDPRALPDAVSGFSD